MQKGTEKSKLKKFRVEKLIKRKGNKLYVKWKEYDSSFNSWIDQKVIVQISIYLPEPESSGGIVKFELDLSNYATQADLKNGISVDTSEFAKKVDLANLKSNVDNLYI